MCGALLAGACQDDALNEQTTPTAKTEATVPVEANEGELLVKFVPEMTEILDRVAQTRSSGAATRSGIPSTDEVLDILGAYDFERVFPVNPKTEEKTREAGLHLWYLVRFDKNTDLKQAMERISQLGEVSKVQCNRHIQRAYRTDRKPVYVMPETLRRHTRAAGDDGLPFADAGLPRQWGYINSGNYDFSPSVAGADVNCLEAWKLCTGDPSIIVAVLDEGVMWSHPDLKGNMWVNEGETLGSKEDADGNGYAGDRYGYNFVSDSPIISWSDTNDSGHGTHVAGVVAAVNGNTETDGGGVCGIAGGAPGKPGVKIMSCQVFSGNSGVTLVGESRAIKYAADNGAVILQCSWGSISGEADPFRYTPGPASEKEWETTYPLEKEALDYFIHNAGSPNGVIDGGLAIFAAGNEYAPKPSFPAAYSGCISVGALAADYTPSSFSNYGVENTFSAPGGDGDYYGMLGVTEDEYDWQSVQGTILSTLVKNNQPVYGYMEGTSMACPHVSGVAALGLSYAVQMRRHFTAEEFKALMVETAVELDSHFSGVKKYHYNHAGGGGSPLIQMDLGSYRGKMGRLVNAGALLQKIAGSGSDMKVPNVYVAPEKKVTVDLSRYFAGNALTYTCTSQNESVVKAEVNGSVLTVTGITVGVTSVTVNVSGGQSQTITVTVRKNAGGNGWM